MALVIMLTGCNVQKHVTRQQSSASTQSESSEAIASRLKKQVKTDATTTKDIHTVESVDTTMFIPGSVLQGKKSLADLVSEGCFEIESNSVKGSIVLDSTSGTLSFSVIEKPRSIPHSFIRVTDTREMENKVIAENEDVQSAETKKIAASSDSSSDVLSRDVNRTVPWWIIPLVISFAILLFFVYRFVRKRLL